MRHRAFETRLLPRSLTAAIEVLPSMSLLPKSSIRPVGLPIHVARVPAAPFARRYPRDFTFYLADPINSIPVLLLRFLHFNGRQSCIISGLRCERNQTEI